LVTVSGTSISFGTATVYSSSQVRTLGAAYASNASRSVVIFRDESAGSVGKAVSGGVSGTGISFGSSVETIYSGSTSGDGALVAGQNIEGNTRLLAFVSTSSDAHSVCLTASGTNVYALGSVVQFSSGKVNSMQGIYDDNANSFLIVYRDGSNSSKGTARVVSVSGTTASYGATALFSTSTNVINVGATYNSSNNNAIISYRSSSDSNKLYLIEGTISGTSIAFGAATSTSFKTNDNMFPVYNSSSNSTAVAFADVDNSNVGEAFVYGSSSTNLTSENYIGMSSGVVDVEGQTEDIGSAVVFNNTGNTTKPHLCFDTNSNKTVIGFIDNAVSEKGTAIVGTVSGTSISFGSETVYETSVTDFPAMVYDSSNNKVIVAYQDEGNTDYGTVAVGTVSGTSISFGTPVVFESAAVQHVSLAFDSNSNKVVVSYADHGNSEHGTAIVGTVSGTSISFGSAAVFQSAQSQRISSTFDSSNNKVVIAYRTTTSKAVVATVSGTSISFGTPVDFYNAESEEIEIGFDSNAGKVVIGYQSSGSDAGLAKVGTVSGTSISFGAEATFESANVASISPVFDNTINKMVLAYSDVGNSRYGTYVVGTISGTDITFGTPSVFASVDTRSQVGAVFDTTSNKVVLAYRDDSNSSYGTSVVMVPGYQEITRGQVASGGAATVDIVGTVSTNQLSLTAGQQYYVQTDGTIGETPADPSVLAGTAISATKLVVKT